MKAPGLALSAAVLVAGATGCSGGDDGLAGQARQAGRERSRQATEAAREAGLPEDVGDVIGDAAGAVGRAFTVTYDTGDGGRATLTQDPPRRRIDVTLPGGTTRATLANGDGSFACEQRAGAWTCLPAQEPPPDVGAFAATDLERTISSLSSSRATYDLRVDRRQVAGVDARCLVTERKASAADDPALGARGELCIAGSGATLLIDQPSQALTATTYEDGAQDGAFDLPAPVSATTTAPPPTG